MLKNQKRAIALVTPGQIYVSFTQGEQAKLLSLLTTQYNDRLENMSNKNKISTMFEMARTENKEYLKRNWKIQS